MVSAVAEAYYKRTRYVKTITTNIYELNFQDHWGQVVKILGLGENVMRTARLEDLRLDYEKDGELKRLRYEVTWKKEGQLYHASVYFHEGQKKFAVRAMKVDQWLQYNRLISTKRLFEKLVQISMRDLTLEGDFSYYGFMFGGWDNFGIKDEKIFVIEDNKITPYIGELPVEEYWMKTFGMKQTGEHSYSSTDGHCYLFDVQNK